MAFQSVPGLPGKVYTPEPCGVKRNRHHCPDCFNCQECSQDRCTLCRDHDCRRGAKRAAGTDYDNET